MAAPSVTAEWNEKFTTCWLRNEDDSIFGRLHLRQWWRPNTRTPEAAWAIELLNPDSDDPPLFVALVQMPALRADTAAVRNDLVARAVKAKLNGEEPIAPPAGPIDERDWRDIVEGLDRLFSAWVDAETAFHNAAARDDPAAGGARWVALTDALNRLYAIDSALKTLWKKLPADLREDASAWSDQYADKTIIHNRRIDPAFDPQTAAGWEAWRQRQRTGRPYEHWAAKRSARTVRMCRICGQDVPAIRLVSRTSARWKSPPVWLDSGLNVVGFILRPLLLGLERVEAARDPGAGTVDQSAGSASRSRAPRCASGGPARRR